MNPMEMGLLFVYAELKPFFVICVGINKTAFIKTWIPEFPYTLHLCSFAIWVNLLMLFKIMEYAFKAAHIWVDSTGINLSAPLDFINSDLKKNQGRQMANWRLNNNCM